MAKQIKTTVPGIYKRGSRYVVPFLDPDGVNRKPSFRTMNDARAFKRVNDQKLHTHTWTDPTLANLTVREYAERWFAAKLPSWGEATAISHRSVLKRHIYPSDLAGKRLGQVVPSDVTAMLGQLTDRSGEPISAGTQNKVRETLSGIFNLAVLDRILTVSPTKGSECATVERAVEHVLSQEQVLSIVAALPERFATLASLASDTGLRISEALGLTWDRIDTTPGLATLTVDRQWRTTGTFGPPKSKAGKRVVPLSDQMVAELLTHRARFGLGSESGHVFTDEDGRPVRHTAFYVMWAAAVAPLGLNQAERHHVFHALRHHYASRLIAARMDVLTVSKLLGHRSPKITMETYTHWFNKTDAFADVRAVLTMTPADVVEAA